MRVEVTSEFRRIESLPRRNWEDFAAEAVELLTKELRTSYGSMRLRDVQAVALVEAYNQRGLFAPLGVGTGKTLISLLAPTVMRAERPLLIVPAQLRDLTINKHIPELSEHWKLHPGLEVVSYNKISNDPDFLKNKNPDLIIADECHLLRHRTAARTKRFIRHMSANPDCRFVGMSGTVTRKSLKDYAHLAEISLREGSPLPRAHSDLQRWAGVVDMQSENPFASPQVQPGALLNFVQDTDWPDEMDVPNRYDRMIVATRNAVRERIMSTPGVVATTKSSLACSLNITLNDWQKPAAMTAHLRTLADSGVTPSGELVTEPLDAWRKGRELSCGFYYEWEWRLEDEPNRIEWLIRRKEWRQFVAERIRYSHTYDTEMQVAQACVKGKIDSQGTYEGWVSIRDLCEPTTVPRWYTNSFVNEVATNASNIGDCIVWVEQVAFAEMLAEQSGLPYFGAGCGDAICDHVNGRLGPCIASIASNSTGKNLQAYSKNIVAVPPTSGVAWEQMLGRTHRPGQDADSVEVDVYQHTGPFRDAFGKAQANALFLKQSTGQEQKLCYAAII